jgi:hypothetical protein
MFAESTEPTCLLRFVLRDGKRILQQRWRSTRYDSDGNCYMGSEWRDVPLEATP